MGRGTDMDNFSMNKFGFFVHFVAKHSAFPDGRAAVSVDETVDSFDVNAFADSLEKMKIPYLIFTVWHYKTRTLYPSAVNEKWRPGNSAKRDLIGEMLDAVTAKGIKVILYTHPRDGQDFPDDERIAVGWGKGGKDSDTDDAPNPETFDRKKWNQYMKELYTELIDRYGDRIAGIYTDGMGPYSSSIQVIDYLMLRRIIKEKNPSLFMIQNYFGQIFSNDYAMPEGYFGYEENEDVTPDDWPACRKALAFIPFAGGWYVTFECKTDVTLIPKEKLLSFILFNASCTGEGGTFLASGPYCDGSFARGITDTMSFIGNELERFSESVLKAVPSGSFPTVSGDTMKSHGYTFWTEAENGEYEYLHMLKLPDGGVLNIPEPENGAVLYSPQPMTGNIKVVDFGKTDCGYLLRLMGEPDKTDTVIRFTKKNSVTVAKTVWINDTDKRIRYIGSWSAKNLDRSRRMGLGCYEYDYTESNRQDDGLFIAIEGSFVEIYGIKAPGYGKAAVYIDGILVGEISEDSDTVQKRAFCFRSENLCGGLHTLELRHTDGNPFVLDALKLIQVIQNNFSGIIG